MENEPKTVGGVPEDTSLSIVDPLLVAQKDKVNSMRSAYMALDYNDLTNAKRTIQSVTIMRIYHQVGRIIHFTEVMDQLEDKIYDSILMNIGGMDSADPATMLMLLKVQADLQNTMIQSQQLIKPYLDMDITTIAPPIEMEETSFGVSIISQESRNNIRSGAQALLTELRKSNPELPQVTSDNTKTSDSSKPKRGRKPGSKNAKAVKGSDEVSNDRIAGAE